MLNSVPPHTEDDVVYLQNGDGSFAQGLRYSAESDPVQIRIADLNGDGLPDLVTVNAILNANVHFQNSGTPGTFLAVPYTSPHLVIGVAVGEVNRDRLPI